MLYLGQDKRFKSVWKWICLGSLTPGRDTIMRQLSSYFERCTLYTLQHKKSTASWLWCTPQSYFLKDLCARCSFKKKRCSLYTFKNKKITASWLCHGLGSNSMAVTNQDIIISRQTLTFAPDINITSISLSNSRNIVMPSHLGNKSMYIVQYTVASFTYLKLFNVAFT